MRALGALASRASAILSTLSLASDTPQRIQLYRAVSAAELKSIQATGQYSIPPGGNEAKYFATSMNVAEAYLNDPRMGASAVVTSLVTQDTYDSLYQGSADGMPIVVATPADLPAINADAQSLGGIMQVH